MSTHTQSIYGKVTALVTLLVGFLAFLAGICMDDVPQAYEARLYLAYLGLAFLAMGMMVAVIDLLLTNERHRG